MTQKHPLLERRGRERWRRALFLVACIAFAAAAIYYAAIDGAPAP